MVGGLPVELLAPSASSAAAAQTRSEDMNDTRSIWTAALVAAERAGHVVCVRAVAGCARQDEHRALPRQLKHALREARVFAGRGLAIELECDRG